MAYYTDFEAEAHGPDADSALYALKVSAYDFDDWEEDNRLMDAKWYSWESDLTRTSIEFPEVLFTLDGFGEDRGDIWRAWAKNGKVETTIATIVIPAPEWVPIQYGLKREL